MCCLVLRQARHRRQHAEAVAREQDDVVRMAADSGQLGVGDVLQRVGAAGKCVVNKMSTR